METRPTGYLAAYVKICCSCEEVVQQKPIELIYSLVHPFPDKIGIETDINEPICALHFLFT